MREREFRLRKRIDVVTAERDRARAQVGKQRRGYTAFCVYCGAKTKSYGHPATCRCHRDLVDVDPFYAALLEEAA